MEAHNNPDGLGALDLRVLLCDKDDNAFQAQFDGEGAQDAGGPYRECLDNLCAELQSTALPLLIPSPNAQQDGAMDRNKFVLNPAATSPRCLRLLRLFGALLGVSLRTSAPLPFELPGYTWKLLLGDTPTLVDLFRVDRCTANLLTSIRHASDETNAAHTLSADEFDAVWSFLSFTFGRSDGVTIPLRAGGEDEPLTYATRHEWCDAVERLRREESAAQLAAIRLGLGAIVPLSALFLFTAAELETLVCGDADWSVSFLKANSKIDLSPSDKRVGFLWEALESFTKEDRALFLQFVWGRSRMPQLGHGERLPQRLQVSGDHGHSSNSNADQRLPSAHTCFFQLHLPPYTTADVLRERLRYAINNGRSIDLDHVTRDAAAWRSEE